MKRPLRRTAGPTPLDDEMREFLHVGRFPEAFYALGAGLPRREAARALWAEHGAAVTAQWAAEAPGTRPRAFWAIGLDMHPQLGLDNDYTPRQLRYARRYGCAGYVPSREVQRRFLRRYGQLHPAEQAASGLPCDTP
jgi:hypothetical protein